MADINILLQPVQRWKIFWVWQISHSAKICMMPFTKDVCHFLSNLSDWQGTGLTGQGTGHESRQYNFDFGVRGALIKDKNRIIWTISNPHLGYFSYFRFNFPSIWQLNHTLYFEQFYLLSFAFNKTLNRWNLSFLAIFMTDIYESWEIIRPDGKPFIWCIIINTDKNQSN